MGWPGHFMMIEKFTLQDKRSSQKIICSISTNNFMLILRSLTKNKFAMGRPTTTITQRLIKSRAAMERGGNPV